jgi:hypothetical protein
VSEWKWTCAYAERSAPIPGGQTAAKMANLDALERNIEPSHSMAGGTSQIESDGRSGFPAGMLPLGKYLTRMPIVVNENTTCGLCAYSRPARTAAHAPSLRLALGYGSRFRRAWGRF